MAKIWRRVSDETGCRLYDFNLLKDRFSLFRDDVSFHDTEHMSRVGAEVFTAVFCDTLLAEQRGEDISSRFYASYAEMTEDMHAVS